MADAPIQVCTALGIIEKFGGLDKLNEALDQNSKGTFQQAILDSAIIDASADVEAAVGQRWVIWGQTSFPRKIVRIAEQLGVYYVWFSTTGGRSVPPEVRQAALDCRAELTAIGKGEISPGSPRPKSRLYPREVDNSDEGRRCTYDVLRFSGMIGGR